MSEKLGLVGRKIGMTRIFEEDGKSVPVTVLDVSGNRVACVKTVESDGYNAVQVAFGSKKPSRVNKALAGQFAKAGIEAAATLKEFHIDEDKVAEFKPGTVLSADMFTAGQKVDVTGTSKGKGFAGVMKRYGFAGGPGGHGAHFHRAPGSVGQCATPSRVFKGLRLPGHMGCDTVTVKNLEVVRIDEEQNLILVKGAVPGGKNGIVRVRMA